MIGAIDWKAKRNHFYGHLKLPQDGQAFLAPVIAHLDECLAKLRDAVLCGKLKIDDAIRIDPLMASAPPASVETLLAHWSSARIVSPPILSMMSHLRCIYIVFQTITALDSKVKADDTAARDSSCRASSSGILP
ncbi:hypothetical protein [Cupriavidus sp. 8B]